jgi:hypothetical protein
MTAKITILVSGIDAETHKSIVDSIVFAAKPFGGQWTSEVKIEEVPDNECNGEISK